MVNEIAGDDGVIRVMNGVRNAWIRAKKWSLQQLMDFRRAINPLFGYETVSESYKSDEKKWFLYGTFGWKLTVHNLIISAS